MSCSKSSFSQGKSTWVLQRVTQLVTSTRRAKKAPEKAFRMRADISAEDKELQGVTISRAEAFGSSSASSEQSDEEFTSGEDTLREHGPGSDNEEKEEEEEDEASDAQNDSG